MVTDLKPDERFGGYLILAELGRGGQAVVCRAHQVGTDRDVALKVYAELEDPGRLERFRREAIAAARFHHPHIVTIFDAGDVEGVPFIAMRLMEGGSLADVIRTGDRLEIHRALAILDDAADAVDAIHRRGLIHRDIKPANVLLDEEGRAHLSDFGIAQLDELPGLTTRGDFLGTVEYISPEQAQGNPATPASDIYSFGVLAYEVLTGQPPFMHRQPNAVLVAHVNETAEAAHERNPSLPADVSPILAQVLAKNPRDRPPTATEIVERLKEALAAVPAVGAGTTKIQADGAATHVIEGGPASPTLVSDPNGVASAETSGSQPRAPRRLILICAGVVAVIGIAAGVILAIANGGSNANAAFQKSIAPQMAALNQASLTTANALSTENSAAGLSALGQVAKSQLEAVTAAEGAISGLSVPSGAQPGQASLLAAVRAERSYLADLVQVTGSSGTAALPRLQATASSVNAAWAQFFKLEPGVTNVITASGLAGLTGLNAALTQKAAEVRAAAAKAAAARAAQAAAAAQALAPCPGFDVPGPTVLFSQNTAPHFGLTITDSSGHPIAHGPTDAVTCQTAQQVIIDMYDLPSQPLNSSGPHSSDSGNLLVDGSWVCSTTGPTDTCTNGSVILADQYTYTGQVTPSTTTTG